MLDFVHHVLLQGCWGMSILPSHVCSRVRCPSHGWLPDLAPAQICEAGEAAGCHGGRICAAKVGEVTSRRGSCAALLALVNRHLRGDLPPLHFAE